MVFRFEISVARHADAIRPEDGPGCNRKRNNSLDMAGLDDEEDSAANIVEHLARCDYTTG